MQQSMNIFSECFLSMTADTTWRLIGSTNIHSFAPIGRNSLQVCIDYQMNSFSDSDTNKERKQLIVVFLVEKKL